MQELQSACLLVLFPEESIRRAANAYSAIDGLCCGADPCLTAAAIDFHCRKQPRQDLPSLGCETGINRAPGSCSIVRSARRASSRDSGCSALHVDHLMFGETPRLVLFED